MSDNAKIKIPDSFAWCKKTRRNRLIDKLPRDFSVLLTFEMAAAEVLSIVEDGLPMPQEHLDLLVVAFREHFARPLEEMDDDEDLKSPSQVEGFVPGLMSWFGFGKAFKSVPKMNDFRSLWRDAGFPYDEGFQYFYRSIKSALLTAIASPDYPRSLLDAGCQEATQLAYRFYDWDQQLGTISSLVAVREEFGIVTQLEELLVCNDWLMERRMTTLMFPQLAVASPLNRDE